MHMSANRRKHRCRRARGHLEELVGLIVARDRVQARAGTRLAEEGIPEPGRGREHASVHRRHRGDRRLVVEPELQEERRWGAGENPRAAGSGVRARTSMIDFRFAISTSPIMYASLTARVRRGTIVRRRRYINGDWVRAKAGTYSLDLPSCRGETWVIRGDANEAESTYVNTRVQNFPLTTLRWTTAPSVFSFPKWKVSSRSSMRM